MIQVAWFESWVSVSALRGVPSLFQDGPWVVCAIMSCVRYTYRYCEQSALRCATDGKNVHHKEFLYDHYTVSHRCYHTECTSERHLRSTTSPRAVGVATVAASAAASRPSARRAVLDVGGEASHREEEVLKLAAPHLRLLLDLLLAVGHPGGLHPGGTEDAAAA